MKKTLLATAAVMAITALPVVSHAQDAAAEAASPLSFNIGAVTDYRFRGISQTRLQPAVQGGADYAAANGLYIGTWLSTIKWIKDAGTINGVDTGSADVEWDIYGGYRGEIQKDFTYDVGVLTYIYPGNHYDNIPGAKKAGTTEIYGALTFGPATVKYSHAVTSLFGTASTDKDSKNSGYLEAAATFDVGGGYAVTPHVGYQHVNHFNDFSYTDYAVTGTKDFFGLTFSLAAIYADTKKINGVDAYVGPNGKNLARATVVFGVKKVF